MPNFIQRLHESWNVLLAKLRKQWWFVLIVGLASGTIHERFYSAINRYIDSHVLISIKPLFGHLFLGGFWNSVGFGLMCMFLVVAGLAIHAYIVSAKVPAIMGSADAMVLNLEMGNFKPAPDWSEYTADFGVFIHARIAITDKPRTVTSFILKAAIPQKDGQTIDYVANCEKEITKEYYHQYNVEGRHFGYRTLIPRREMLPDLLAKLQTPLQPETHAEGWIRFELKDVKNESGLERSGITLFAVDARGKHYQLETANMRIPSLQDREYIFRDNA